MSKTFIVIINKTIFKQTITTENQLMNRLKYSQKKLLYLTKQKQLYAWKMNKQNTKQKLSNSNKELYKLFQELSQKTEKNIQDLIQINSDMYDKDVNQEIAEIVQKINYEKCELIQKIYQFYFLNQEIHQNMFRELKKIYILCLQNFMKEYIICFKIKTLICFMNWIKI